MGKLKIGFNGDKITAFFFQLCIIANNVFGSDTQLFGISKIITLAFFGVVVLRIVLRGKVMLNKILLLPTLFTVYCAATMLWAYNANTVLVQMVTQVQLYILLVFTFWSMNNGATMLDYVRAIYISGLGLALFAVARYGGLSQYVDAMENGKRMGDAIANRNTYGMVFGNAALCAAYYMILRKKPLHIISFVLFAFFALSSASRKAALMIAVGTVAMAVLNYGWRRIYKTLIFGVVSLFAISLILKLPYFGEINERIMLLFSGEQDASDRIRRDMIQYGLQLIKEKPVHGYGIDNFSALYITGQYSHNNYIELMVGGGLIALVMYYLMLGIPTLSLLTGKHKKEKFDPLHLMLFVRLGVELGFGLAMVQLYNKNSWVLIGVLMAEAVKASRKSSTLQRENIHEIAAKNQEGTA